MKIENYNIEHVLPGEIEKNSFVIIDQELENLGKKIPDVYLPIVKRVIHTTADFAYADTICFSEDAIPKMQKAIQMGAHIVTDTNMVMAGINKKTLAGFGGAVHCFMADADVSQRAKESNCTRARISMEKAAEMKVPIIFAIGNAPTALIALAELMEKGFVPAGIIGVPVGFVNVVQSKELIMETSVPYIVNKGRKGGSNVAAAICNALLYEIDQSRGGTK